MNTKRPRSPSFPFVPLGTAVSRLVQLEEYFGRHPAPATKAGLAWKMKENSSQAFQMLAALKAFGFIAYKGSGEDREAILTEPALTYLRAQQESIKNAMLSDAALKPKIIKKYWDTWGADRPPNPVCLDQLGLKGGFTDSAARTFLRVYDDTIAYAGLSNSDKIDNNTEDQDGEVEVGCLIQWESNGILQFVEPKKVRAIEEHDGNTWVFVDGSKTGILKDEVIVEQATQNTEVSGPRPPQLQLPEQDDIVKPNEQEWLRGPLSQDTSYRILVKGDLGPKEIGKLIKMLTAQKSVLSEDEEDEPN